MSRFRFFGKGRSRSRKGTSWLSQPDKYLEKLSKPDETSILDGSTGLAPESLKGLDDPTKAGDFDPTSLRDLGDLLEAEAGSTPYSLRDLGDLLEAGAGSMPSSNTAPTGQADKTTLPNQSAPNSDNPSSFLNQLADGLDINAAGDALLEHASELESMLEALESSNHENPLDNEPIQFEGDGIQHVIGGEGNQATGEGQVGEGDADASGGADPSGQGPGGG